MKKVYEAPSVEKIAFQYRDQVVAASGNHTCITEWSNQPGESGCAGETTQTSQHV